MSTLHSKLEILQTEAFSEWLESLRDREARSKILARITRAQAGNLGSTKALGGKVAEMKIDYGPGYRVYFTRRGNTTILLLGGGDKRTQNADIQAAKEMVKELDD